MTLHHSSHHLTRRGMMLGTITPSPPPKTPQSSDILHAWKEDRSIVFPSIVADNLETYAAHIQASHQLMEKILNGNEFIETIEQSHLIDNLNPEFALLASSLEEHDEQAIEKLYFDVEEHGEVIGEDLWCKASWLSFHDDDASLRFRFSFGMEGFEDVAADPMRQHWAGELCTRLFPESEIITKNTIILNTLELILGHTPAFVERIVYFNAPNGGAQFHHDVERGHAGVVFAQLSGATYWLSASKPRLMQAMRDFAHLHTLDAALEALLHDERALSDYMEEQDHARVEALIDHNPDFIRYMIEQGFSHTLHAGDVLFLPQRDLDHCVWHSVFCLGEDPGEALSFAVR